jgi:DNA-binding response OmpR family regulator
MPDIFVGHNFCVISQETPLIINQKVKIRSMNKMKLLFVEDDTILAFMLKEELELLGNYDVCVAYNGLEGIDAYTRFQPDIIVTDVEMPVLNGIEMTKHIRKKDKRIPIIFATGRTNVITGYKSDIDSFVNKPFLPAELDAHVQAIFRRRKAVFNDYPSNESIAIGKYMFHIEQQTLQYGEQIYKLTARGSQILERLYEKKGNLVKRAELLDELWGKSHFFNSRSLDVFIYSLRKHLAHDPNIELKTIRGTGLVLIINAD